MLQNDVVLDGGALRLAHERDLITTLELVETRTDLREVADEAASIRQVAGSLGRTDVALWAEITELDALARTDGTEGIASRGGEILEWALRQGDPRLASRCHALLAMMDLLAGHAGSGAEHATIAVTLLDGTERPRLRAKLLTRQAVGLFAAGLPQHGFDVSRRSLTLAEQLADHQLVAQLASNAFHAAIEEGFTDESVFWMQRLEAAIAVLPELEAQAGDVLAHGHLVAGRPLDAVAVLERTPECDLGTEQPEIRAARKLLMARARHAIGELPAASAALGEAETIAEAHRLDDISSAILQEQAAVAASQGDFERAYVLHRTFHDASRARWLEARRSRVDHLFAEQNVTEALERAEQAEAAVAVDPLTRVRNRRWVEDSLPDVVHSWHADGRWTGSLAILDLDHFKQVNDRFGHPAGDDVLVAVAGSLQECRGVREVARIGGEEFLLVLQQHADPQHVAAEVLSAVRLLRWPEIDGGLRLTASIGFAGCEPGATSAELLREADRRLYLAKHAGRDTAIGPW